MEKSNSNGGALCHHLLIIFLLCFNPSSSSAAETQFFVNCGSTTAVNADDGRVFAADQPPGNFKLDGGSQILSDPANATASSLYKTAREFTRRSGYDFPVPENTSYLLLRLHFAAFNPRLSAARFDVHASNFIILSNFTAANSTAGAPLISEFYLPAASRNRLRIRFIPSSDSAFISAIELLPLTSSFFVDNRSVAVPPGGGSRPAAGFFGFQSSALRTVHRVNIGGGSRGGEIPPDSLFRPWRPDNEFYATPSLGNESDTATIPSGAADGIRDLAASEPALGSCRYERVTNGGERPANLTWRFQVKKNTRQFLRLYFLNCVNDAAIRDFNLYINTNFPATVNPFLYIREFVADSDESGFFEISISPSPAVENGVATAAYLNALEIMEFLPATPVNETDDGGNRNPSNHHRRNLAIWLSAAAAAAAVVLISLIAFLLKRKKKKNNNKGSNSVKNSATGEKKSHSWITVHTDNTTTQGSPLPELNLKLKMPLSEILAVTDNFNPKLLIGSGGFGKVYEGKLANGVTVAVKRSESGHGQGRPEFQTEVLVLSKIRHRHLVSLIGYCDDGAEMILVYEFMKNGTLRDHLYRSDDDSSSSSPPSSVASTTAMLNWKQRLEICIGSAKGLHYLHTGSDGGIIHRDVKSTNILLDENYVAKVADFGLSQAGLPDPDHHSMALKGSFGYLDPEFFRTFQLTDKSDVYSFGVVLLEVVCARPAIVTSTAAKREEINLAEWGMAWQKRGEIEKIVDPSILEEVNPSSLRKFAEVAEKCLRPDGVDRPTMLDVCWDLEYALQLQQGTPARREPSEDSMMDDASSNILRPIVSGFRDTSFIVGEEDDDDEMSAGDDSAGDVDATATDSGSVFSQHRVDGAR